MTYTGTAVVEITQRADPVTTTYSATWKVTGTGQRPTAVTIEVNPTKDQTKPDPSNDITALQPQQPIQAQITLTGASGEVALSMDPADSAVVKPTSLDLRDGQSEIVTITPLRVSKSPNDVRIVAKLAGEVMGTEDLTIVQIQWPQIVDSDTTPEEMKTAKIRRIPPAQKIPVKYKVEPDLGDSGQFVLAEVAGQSDANGRGRLVDPTTDSEVETQKLTGEGVLWLRGKDQTAPTPGQGGGNAGNLRLIARARGEQVASSDGFSVAAVPREIYFRRPGGLPGLPDPFCPSFEYDELDQNGTRRVGICVIGAFQSDSGKLDDLDQVMIQERVYGHEASGSLTDFLDPKNFVTGPPFPANVRGFVDVHATPWGRLTSPGACDLWQLFVFQDSRTGALSSMAGSGFEIPITYEERGGKWLLTTSKAGRSVTVPGDQGRMHSSDAGTTSGVLSNSQEVQPFTPPPTPPPVSAAVGYQLAAFLAAARGVFVHGEPVDVLLTIVNEGPDAVTVPLNYPGFRVPGYRGLTFSIPGTPQRGLEDGFRNLIPVLSLKPGQKWSVSLSLQRFVRSLPPGQYTVEYSLEIPAGAESRPVVLRAEGQISFGIEPASAARLAEALQSHADKLEQSTDFYQRLGAAEALSAAGDPLALRYAPLLLDLGWEAAAFRLLANFPEEAEARRIVIEAAKSGRFPRAVPALDLLGTWQHALSALEVRQLLQSDQVWLRRASLSYVERVPRPEYLEHLAPLLSDPDQPIRMKARKLRGISN